MNSKATAHQFGSFFRPDVEGLRAVAVLLVVCRHCGISWCPGGFVGVDVFFVLSGYLITGLLAAEYRATSRIHLLRFYARRARRLLPACALVLLATTLFAALVFSPQEIAFTGRAARAAALYMSNVFFDQSAADYFSPNVEGNPLLHTWSLGLEEQFYLVWPMLILAANRGPGGNSDRFGFLARSWPFRSLTASTSPSTPRPSLSTNCRRGREFAAGGLALLPVLRTPVSTSWPVWGGIGGWLSFSVPDSCLREAQGFPGGSRCYRSPGRWRRFSPEPRRLSVGSCGAECRTSPIYRSPIVLLVSLALAICRVRRDSFPRRFGGGHILAAIASLLAAAFTFTFVERPIRANPYLGARSASTLDAAAGATLLTVAASWALLHFGEELTTDRRLESISAATTDVADISPKACWSQGATAEVRICKFGASGSPRSVVLFGDSHAIQWFNPFRTAANAKAWRLIHRPETWLRSERHQPTPFLGGLQRVQRMAHSRNRKDRRDPSLCGSHGELQRRHFSRLPRGGTDVHGRATFGNTTNLRRACTCRGSRIIVIRDTAKSHRSTFPPASCDVSFPAFMPSNPATSTHPLHSTGQPFPLSGRLRPV